MSDLVFLPAHQLAKAISNRQVSALEVLEAYLSQIAQHNPKINAIITLVAQARNNPPAVKPKLLVGVERSP